MKYNCPECQKPFSETPSLEDFVSQCPHCGVEVSIQADQALVERTRIEAEKKEEAARKEAEQIASEAAKQAARRKLEEENAKAVAQVERSLKRICPHCGREGSWRVRSKPGVESFVVRCSEYEGCGKHFTIPNSSEDMMTPLADILKELEVIRFRFGVLLVCLFVIPAICWIIVAIIYANK